MQLGLESPKCVSLNAVAHFLGGNLGQKSSNVIGRSHVTHEASMMISRESDVAVQSNAKGAKQNKDSHC